MKKASILIAAGALILAALACGRSTPAPPTAVPPTAVPPTVAPPTAVPPTKVPPSQLPSGTMELTLKNDSGMPVCYVYISPTESESWGDNWLGANESVPSGSSRTFQVPEGSYDVRADNCENNLVAYQYEVNLAGQMTWTLDPLPRARLVVVNDSSQEICHIFISPSDRETWGPDWMGRDATIPAGGNRTFQVPLGTYDLVALDCDGNPVTEEVYEQEIAGDMTWTISP